MHLTSRLHAARVIRSNVSAPPRPMVASRITPIFAAATEVSLKEGLLSRDDDEEPEFVHDNANPDVDAKQIEEFLQTIVSEVDIAEVKLQVGSFNLHVRRSKSAFPSSGAVSPAPVEAVPSVAAPVALASIEASMDETVDESLIYVQSPKVGIFRRGKFAGGKRVGKEPAIKEGDQVKKGQALGFIEQLGSHFPVEAPQAGEVVKFLLEDGAAVSYQETCIEFSPFFGGHIIGDAKLV